MDRFVTRGIAKPDAAKQHSRVRPPPPPPPNKFHGEARCERTTCTRRAYYYQNASALCGFHAKKTLRRPLPHNPDRLLMAERERELHSQSVSRARASNAASRRRGEVTCSGMGMFRSQQPTYTSGFENVFPNNWHGNRRDGRGVPELSPMRLGPVHHPQPGLPPARNLENFYQFSKRFPDETLSEFDAAQRAAFEDPEPHRHKRRPSSRTASGKPNIPIGWVWRLANGSRTHMTYVESRQFYCNYYERLAKEQPAFQRLLADVRSGTNVRICGFDGFQPTKPLLEHYGDTSRPFGHELVLYTMLTVEDPEEYPWRLMKTTEF